MSEPQPTGIVYILWCLDEDRQFFGFHDGDYGDPPDVKKDGICCSECGSHNVEWRKG